MITIRQKGRILRVANTTLGESVNASNIFEVGLALQHWQHERHGQACCPVCREESRCRKSQNIQVAA